MQMKVRTEAELHALLKRADLPTTQPNVFRSVSTEDLRTILLLQALDRIAIALEEISTAIYSDPARA